MRKMTRWAVSSHTSRHSYEVASRGPLPAQLPPRRGRGGGGPATRRRGAGRDGGGRGVPLGSARDARRVDRADARGAGARGRGRRRGGGGGGGVRRARRSRHPALAAELWQLPVL